LAADEFEKDFGIPVRIETPVKITDNFPLAAQAGKGPDIVVWPHDKVGEWADAGVIAPIEVTSAYKQQFYPMAGKPCVIARSSGDIPLASKLSA
jgi:maltose/maltodextrin transport system substrate-binding protein